MIRFRGKAKDFDKYIKYLEYVCGFYGMTLEEIKREMEFREWMLKNAR